jgi:hypothetical protein
VLVAPFVWLFGISPVALRLALLLVGLAAIAAIALLARLLYSPHVALLAAGLLAFGSPYFVVLGVRAYGGYVETLLFGTLLLLLALRGAAPAGRSLWATASLGLLAGLALWTNVLVAPFVLAAAAILWWQRRTDLLGRKGLLLIAALLLGASPAIIYNVLHGAATLTTILGITAVGARGAGAATPSLLGNLWLEVTVSLPIVVGGFLGGYQSAGLTVAGYRAAATAHPLAYIVDLLLALAAVALVIAAGVEALRTWRDLRAPDVEVDPAERDHRARLQGRAALLLVTLCYFVAMAFTRQANLFAVPRYLFPIAVCAPVLAQQLLCLARWVIHRVQAVPRAARIAVPCLALAALLCWNLAGAAAVTPTSTAALDHGIWIINDDAALLQLLNARHVRTVISNDYWEGLRLTFESGESLIAVMVTPEGHPGFNRYPPYVARGLADPRPAYVELTGTPEVALHQARLQAGELPGYSMAVVGQFTVFVPD